MDLGREILSTGFFLFDITIIEIMRTVKEIIQVRLVEFALIIKQSIAEMEELNVMLPELA